LSIFQCRRHSSHQVEVRHEFQGFWVTFSTRRGNRPSRQQRVDPKSLAGVASSKRLVQAVTSLLPTPDTRETVPADRQLVGAYRAYSGVHVWWFIGTSPLFRKAALRSPTRWEAVVVALHASGGLSVCARPASHGRRQKRSSRRKDVLTIAKAANADEVLDKSGVGRHLVLLSLGLGDAPEAAAPDPWLRLPEAAAVLDDGDQLSGCDRTSPQTCG